MALLIAAGGGMIRSEPPWRVAAPELATSVMISGDPAKKSMYSSWLKNALTLLASVRTYPPFDIPGRMTPNLLLRAP